MEDNAKSFDGLYLGLVMGGAIGVLAGLMFAPKSGREFRDEMKEKGCKLYGDTEKILSDARMRTKSVIDEAMHKVDGFKREAEQHLSEARAKVCKILSYTGAEKAPLHTEEEPGAEA